MPPPSHGRARAARLCFVTLFAGLLAHCGATEIGGTTTDGAGNEPASTALVDPDGTAANGNLVVASGNGNGTATTGGTTAPSTVPKSMSLPAGVLHLPITGCNQFDYFAMVAIGTDKFSLLIDTGSTTTALAASTCTNCSIADTYDVSKGTATSTTASSTYADGSGWTGTVYADSMALGTVAAPVTTRVPTKFVAITSANDFFSTGSCGAVGDLAFDGILGLGPNALLRTNTTSFFSGLVGSKTLAADIFSFRHCNVGGDMWLGGYDASIPSSAPVYTDMVTTQTWGRYYSMAVNSMGLGGTDLGLASTSIGPMVVDNGTGGLLLSAASYDALTRALASNANFVANFGSDFFTNGVCVRSKLGLSTAQIDAALPKVSFVLPKSGGGSFTVSMTANGSYLLGLRASDNTAFYCPLVATTPQNTPPLFGNAAMRQHILIFDRAAGRIGFAPHATCPQGLAVGTSG